MLELRIVTFVFILWGVASLSFSLGFILCSLFKINPPEPDSPREPDSPPEPDSRGEDASPVTSGEIEVGSRVSFKSAGGYRWSVPRRNFYGIVEKLTGDEKCKVAIYDRKTGKRSQILGDTHPEPWTFLFSEIELEESPVAVKSTVNPKFKVGDQVVPIKKSVGDTLEESFAWKDAKAGRGFLFFENTDTVDDKQVLVCDGDFFLEEDLVLYAPPAPGPVHLPED